MIKGNILIIGQFSPPLNGCSLANDMLIKHLDLNKVPFKVINTSTKSINNKELGKVSIKKIFEFLGVYVDVFKIINVSIVYTTPGQTFLGVLKYSPFYLLCLLLKKPYIIHIHGNYVGKEYNQLKGIKKKIYGYFLSNSSLGIVLSETLEDNFKDLLPKSKIRVVKNFSSSELLNSSLVKKTDKLHILYLSNLMREKGIIDLLDACILLKNEGINFELKIAGKLEEGIELETKSRFLQLGSSCTYLGTVIGVAKLTLLQESNVLCLPTYYNQEGQPIAILEGMATKNIIVTTNHAGIPDIINRSNGFFVKSQSPNDIRDKFLEIESNLDSYVLSIGEHNFKTVFEKYTEEAFAHNIISIFNELSESK